MHSRKEKEVGKHLPNPVHLPQVPKLTLYM